MRRRTGKRRPLVQRVCRNRGKEERRTSEKRAYPRRGLSAAAMRTQGNEHRAPVSRTRVEHRPPVDFRAGGLGTYRRDSGREACSSTRYACWPRALGEGFSNEARLPGRYVRGPECYARASGSEARSSSPYARGLGPCERAPSNEARLPARYVRGPGRYERASDSDARLQGRYVRGPRR